MLIFKTLNLDRMKKILLFLLLFSSTHLFAQDFGGDKVGLINFIKRMYTNSPFDGVKIMQNDDGKNYLICVISLKNDPNKTESTLFTIADVKARGKASQYFNQTSTSIEFVVISKEEKSTTTSLTSTQTTELLKESSTGYINGLEQLTNFVNQVKQERIFIYYKEIK